MNQNHNEPGTPLPARAFEAFLADPPWSAQSCLAAEAATIGGMVSWLGDITSPARAQMGGSYMGGFLIGRAFRRFLKIAALLAAIVLAGTAAMTTTGWLSIDWVDMEAHAHKSLAWVNGEADGLTNLLAGYLPSAGAGGVSAYFGFRKKQETVNRRTAYGENWIGCRTSLFRFE